MNRLDILFNGKQIDREIYQLISEILNEIKDYDEEKKWRFLTHASIALMRIKQNEKVDSMSEIIIHEINNNINFDKAKKVYKKWFGKFSYDIPKEEKDYIYVHILNYLEEKNENSSRRTTEERRN